MSTPMTLAAPTVPGYAKACGIVALILAIVGMVIPVAGVLFITPLAILFGLVGLHGGDRLMGVAVIVLVAVNLLISPTFWLNVAAGSSAPNVGGVNRLLTYFDLLGVLAMIYLAVRRSHRV